MRVGRWPTRACPKGFKGGALPNPVDADGTRPDTVMCSIADREPPTQAAQALARGERAFEITGYSFHEAFWVVLMRSAGRWNVIRVVEPPRPGDTGPVSPVPTP